mgnify:CR=1 FL=1
MLFNEKLKMLRKENNLTQEKLAEKLNVSRQAITKWENNEGTPDIENLKQISILFDTTIDELVKDEKNITIGVKEKYTYIQELEINHTKHFDINISASNEVNIKPNVEEKVKIELLSNEEENLIGNFNIKFDDLYNRLDIGIKGKKQTKDIIMNIYLPEKYINHIELKSKIKRLNIANIEFKKLEYDGELKYLNVRNSKGEIALNTTKCDIEVNYDKLDGILEINTINSTARIELPKGTEYKTVLKGIRNEFIDTINTEDAQNVIELNGINSKLMVIEY